MKINFIRKSTLFITGILLTTALSYGQQSPKLFGKTVRPEQINPQNGLIRCASTEYEEYLRENTPGMETRAQFEQWLAPKIQAAKTRRLSSPNSVNEIITIPVVVHVIHNGDAVGTNENIADAQVLSQITVLNQDYRRMINTPGYNNNPIGADIEIEFCMAQVDPDGNPTTGIDRVNLNRSSWNTESAVEGTLKPNTIWDPTKYFNIWVCNFGGDDENGLGSTLGYAQFPNTDEVPGVGTGNGGRSTDGVIIGYRYFGSEALYPQGTYDDNYNRGRTATHEIGHCFGLFHPNGDNSSCSVNAADSNKDYCPDTPATSILHYECTRSNSCPSSPGNDMIENYMDYTPDACMNIFTQDQKERIQAVLQYAPRRSSLRTSNVCQPTAGYEDFEMLNGINIYPNPAHNVLNIAVDANNLPDSFSIYNSLGQSVANVTVTSNTNLSINTGDYSTGIYFIRIVKGTQTKTIKFIKE